ncbi:RNA-dependent DNA polymerase [Leptolyngbya sp. 'hensonii']|uniref:RNA-directed DNA polymerase n=1 Tax=Leptolyngbya sp. 'hensonii' TaxID=1922337 RepID=UPI0009502EE9|nr:RNA-directed DNA polymerase [Leptolyngbya sp. 'hensonii']OLP18375.1 RNA-dependent DNA polymerase [Leptolyngbya sp. 'hensonii']
MKRYGSLYPQITAFENLLTAAKQAQRQKRYRDPVLAFNYNLESELLQLQRELQTQTYEPGEYKVFEIYEPKRRVISAAPYRDRVVHHALCNIIVPIFDRTFIATTYANRQGYGSHLALRQFVHYARSSRYVLQCDICKYFPSIDIAILKQTIQRKLKCQETLWLIDRILDNRSEGDPLIDYFPGDTLLTPLERPKGLPIGNLTSQFFANVYLNGFDRYIKETLKVSKYLRYVDDFSLFSDDRDFLSDCRSQIEAYLTTLRLKIHPIKSQLIQTRHGGRFVGFRVLPDRIRVRNYNLQIGRRRLKQLQADYARGRVSEHDVAQSLQSWNAHLAHGDTWQLRQHIFKHLNLPHPLQ